MRIWASIREASEELIRAMGYVLLIMVLLLMYGAPRRLPRE